MSRRILPLVFVLYVCNFLDRTNISMAALQMNRDLHFSATAYGLGAGIFFVGYALFEVPSNMILARVGARRWIARIMIGWGFIACAMIFVRTPAEFYVLRFLLGVAEAGFLPGIVYYLGLWFPTAARARAISGFMIAIPISSMLGAPLGGSLLGLDGIFHLAGWQWLFLVEGLPAVVLGLAVLALLADTPEAASWLSGEERAWLADRVRRDQDESRAHDNLTTFGALTQPLLWLLTIAYFVFFVIGFVYLFWAPTVIQEALGTSNFATGIVVGVIACIATVSVLIVGASSDRTGERTLHVGACALIAALGYAGAALLPNAIARVASFALVMIGTTAFLAPFWCLPTMLLRGRSAAPGIALVNAVGSLGGFAGPYATGWLRETSGGTRTAFLVMSAVASVAAALMVALSRAVVFARPGVDVRGFELV